jgi:glutaredoxin
MLSFTQMQEIAKTQNVAFFKSNCPFCTASQKLIEALLESKILDSFDIYTLGQDFDNETLTDLVSSSGWQPDGVQSIASKPQIFVQGQYVGGNFEFYKSKWNIEENMPNLKNPMRF